MILSPLALVGHVAVARMVFICGNAAAIGIPAKSRPRTPEKKKPLVDAVEYIDPAMWI